MGRVHAAKFEVPAERLTECLGVPEHRGEGCSSAVYIPGAEILVECLGVLEHPAHISDAACVPSADILVEEFGTREHRVHVGDGACVPRADALVEMVCTRKHKAHVGAGAGVPRADIIIEVHGPSVARHILECAEEERHVGDPTRVPRRDVAVGRSRRTRIGQPRITRREELSPVLRREHHRIHPQRTAPQAASRHLSAAVLRSEGPDSSQPH